MRPALVSATVLIGLTVACLAAGVFGAAIAGAPPPEPEARVADIPAAYLAAYRDAAAQFDLGSDGWSYLAAVGEVESDHGRLEASGVRSGQNAHGCCAGPMQIHNGFGAGAGTWGRFKVDGNDDGRFDIYNPDDAIGTAARYLRVSGAPARWPDALFAYNHASWYVDRVTAQAAAYRRAGVPHRTVENIVPITDGGWLASVPGFPGERCDRRIIPDVVALTSGHSLVLTDCFGGEPHAMNGEHPLGLATDVSPVDGDWRRTERLARAAGWLPACAASGCADRGPFRVVLYNGYPGHGDPRFSNRPHLHLSWMHGAAPALTPAPWVRTLLATPATTAP